MLMYYSLPILLCTCVLLYWYMTCVSSHLCIGCHPHQHSHPDWTQIPPGWWGWWPASPSALLWSPEHHYTAMTTKIQPKYNVDNNNSKPITTTNTTNSTHPLLHHLLCSSVEYCVTFWAIVNEDLSPLVKWSTNSNIYSTNKSIIRCSDTMEHRNTNHHSHHCSSLPCLSQSDQNVQMVFSQQWLRSSLVPVPA